MTTNMNILGSVSFPPSPPTIPLPPPRTPPHPPAPPPSPTTAYYLPLPGPYLPLRLPRPPHRLLPTAEQRSLPWRARCHAARLGAHCAGRRCRWDAAHPACTAPPPLLGVSQKRHSTAPHTLPHLAATRPRARPAQRHHRAAPPPQLPLPSPHTTHGPFPPQPPPTPYHPGTMPNYSTGSCCGTFHTWPRHHPPFTAPPHHCGHIGQAASGQPGTSSCCDSGGVDHSCTLPHLPFLFMVGTSHHARPHTTHSHLLPHTYPTPTPRPRHTPPPTPSATATFANTGWQFYLWTHSWQYPFHYLLQLVAFPCSTKFSSYLPTHATPPATTATHPAACNDYGCHACTAHHSSLPRDQTEGLCHGDSTAMVRAHRCMPPAYAAYTAYTYPAHTFHPAHLHTYLYAFCTACRTRNDTLRARTRSSTLRLLPFSAIPPYTPRAAVLNTLRLPDATNTLPHTTLQRACERRRHGNTLRWCCTHFPL